MKILILNGSMRPGQNTDTLLMPVADTLQSAGASVETILLRERAIGPCQGCYACQQVADAYGCVLADDMQAIVARIIESDAILLATPIYTWYCTAPMKALLDRHYGLNKFYGSAAPGSLWAGKGIGIVATCGYPVEDGTGPFEQGIRRLCEHSALSYLGMLAVRDLDDRASFVTPEAVRSARHYALQVFERLDGDVVSAE